MSASKHIDRGWKHLTDQELISIVQAGDLSPGAEIYDRYSDRIYNFTRRILRNEALAAEATQEVFLKMLRHANTFKSGANLSTWLFAIARNQCRDHFRNSATRAETEPEEALAEQASELYGSPDRPVEQQWNARRVEDALSILMPDQREAILLFRYREMSHADIARVVGSSVTAVKARIFRGMEIMRQYLIHGIRPAPPPPEQEPEEAAPATPVEETAAGPAATPVEETAVAPAPAPVEETNV